MGTDKAIYFSGATGCYLYQGTLCDASMSAMCIDWWMAPQDGQLSSEATIFCKWNSTANATMNRVWCYLNSAGRIKFNLYANGSGNTLESSYVFPDGTSSWAYVCITQDTANGIRLFVNGQLNAHNVSGTQGMAAGVASEFYVGAFYGSATNSISASYYGSISQFRLRNKYIEQKDLDIAMATTYTKPATPDGAEVDIRAQLRPANKSECQRNISWEDMEIARNSATIYRVGGVLSDFSATDRLKIFVRS